MIIATWQRLRLIIRLITTTRKTNKQKTNTQEKNSSNSSNHHHHHNNNNNKCDNCHTAEAEANNNYSQIAHPAKN